MKSEINQVMLRIISHEKPVGNAVRVEASLEDVFLYYFGEKVKSIFYNKIKKRSQKIRAPIKLNLAILIQKLPPKTIFEVLFEAFTFSKPDIVRFCLVIAVVIALNS